MRAVFSVTFVCTGNICRSPTAHGVFLRRLSDAGLTGQVRVDSAGTHDLHRGEGADRRSQRHALARGYDLSRLRARPLAAKDFEHSDLLDHVRRGVALRSPPAGATAPITVHRG